MYWNVPRIVPCAVSGAVIGRQCRGLARRTASQRSRFREAEVEQLGAGLGQHDVAGLEIAMDDAGRWALSSASAISIADLQRVGERQRALGQPRGQRLAFEVLHDEKLDVVLSRPTSYSVQMFG